MKTSLIFSLILVSMFPAAVSYAQVNSADLGANASGAITTPETPLTVTQKKVKAETELRTLESQFRLFITRTQLTIDRLTTKGVDTKKAQTELSAALTALNVAKTELDLFTDIVVTDEMTEKTIEKVGLKASLVKIQDSLKEVRTHLIQSLAELKTSVTLTISQ